MIGFIGGSSSQRMIWIKENLLFENMMGHAPVVLFWNKGDGDQLYLEGSPVYAPGFHDSIELDLCMEFAMSRNMIRDLNDTADLFSRTAIADYEIRSVRDPFWHQSGRSLISALFTGAIYRWANIFDGVRSTAKMETLTSMFLNMYREIRSLKLTDAGGSHKTIEKPTWWELLPREQRTILDSLVFQNAGTTTGSIFAEVTSYTSFLSSFTRGRGIPPLFRKQQKALYIYVPALKPKALYAVLKAVWASRENSKILAAEIDLWGEPYRSVLSEIQSDCSGDVDLYWTSSNKILGGSESDDMLWGYTNNYRLLNSFYEMVRSTAGNPSGLLTALSRETPSQLMDDEALAVISGQWRVVAAPQGTSFEDNAQVLPLERKEEVHKEEPLGMFQSMVEDTFTPPGAKRESAKEVKGPSSGQGDILMDGETNEAGTEGFSSDISSSIPRKGLSPGMAGNEKGQDDFCDLDEFLEDELQRMKEQGIWEEPDEEEEPPLPE